MHPVSSYSSVHPSGCTHHEFSVHPSGCTHHEFSVHASGCTHEFSVHPSTCTHDLSDHPSDCTHEFSLCIRQPVRMHRLHLDEIHTTFSDQRLVSVSKPQEGFLCCVCFNSLFTQATYAQDRLRHVYHMKIKKFCLAAVFSTRSVSFRILGSVFRLHL